ncbi:MAG: tRNA (cytidine(34)-2'-O)-methyltransferase [Planctomycetota bacterium]
MDSSSPFHVILHEPQIPQNTGNIGRICVGFNARLTILGKPGFDMGEKALRRAGLDYWKHLSWELIMDETSWTPPPRIFALSSKADKSLHEENFQPGDAFIFGSEDRGLPDRLRSRFPLLKIPAPGPIRSFNVANSVAMVLLEAHRQQL